MISPHSVFNIPRSLNSVFRESFNIVSLAVGCSSRDNYPQKFIPSLEKVKVKRFFSFGLWPAGDNFLHEFMQNLERATLKCESESEMNIILRLWPAGDNFPRKFMQTLERAALK